MNSVLSRYGQGPSATRAGQRPTAIIPLLTALVEPLEGRVLLSAGAPTILASFNGSSDGIAPIGDMVLFGSTLYGTTSGGGTNNDGTVFSLPVGGGTPTVLASFDGTDGGMPEGGLILFGGTLYGTTYNGGANGDGTVFSLPIGGGTPTVLASLNGDVGNSAAGLILSGSTLYGTTSGGGTNNDGTVFSLPVGGGTPTVLASFDGTDGDYPQTSLILSGSTLYGTAVDGGVNGDGTVFSLPIGGGTPTVLASLGGASGDSPYAGVILSGSTLYGTTGTGPANSDGTVFSVPVGGGAPTVLATFDGTDGTGGGGLVLFGSTLYGAGGGGAYDSGAVFSLPIGGGTPALVANFNTGGAAPGPGLILSGGTLYGTTEGGGAFGDGGTVFSVSLASDTLVFASPPSSATAGSSLGTITVDVDSPSGGIDASDNSTVTLAIPNAQSGVTLAGTTSVTAVNGVATFSDLSINVAGTYTLTATDGSDTPANSPSFTIGSLPANNSPLIPSFFVVTLQVASVAGTPLNGDAVVTVTNSGSTTVTGKDTLALYASPDGNVDSSSTKIVSLTKQLSLKALKAVRLSLPIRRLTLPVGDYTVLAQITDASGGVSTSNNGPNLFVSTPVISLAGSISAVKPLAVTLGRVVSFTLALTNSGNIASSGIATLVLGLSADGATVSVPIATVRKRLVIRPGGRPVILRLAMKIPATATNVAGMNLYPIVTLSQGTQTLTVAGTTLIAIG